MLRRRSSPSAVSVVSENVNAAGVLDFIYGYCLLLLFSTVKCSKYIESVAQKFSLPAIAITNSLSKILLREEKNIKISEKRNSYRPGTHKLIVFYFDKSFTRNSYIRTT